MNREIKFKAKRSDNGEWVKGSLMNTPFGTFIEWYDDSICNKIEVDPNTVCQFTGRYDYYGKELWENDIVTHECKFYEGTIVWSDIENSFKLINSNGRKICELWKAPNIRRVGSALDMEDNHE